MANGFKIRTGMPLALLALAAFAAAPAARWAAMRIRGEQNPSALAGMGACGSYVWLDDHTYLMADGFPTGQLLQVDLKAKTRSVFDRFAYPQGSPGVPGLSVSPYAGAVSPDSRYALWSSTSGWQLLDRETGKTRILSKDVPEEIRRPLAEGPCDNAAWMPGSRAWIALSHPAGKSAMLTVRDLKGKSIASGSVGRTNFHGVILGVLPGDVVLLADGVRLFRVDADHRFAVTFSSYRLPDDADLKGVSLSPDKRRLLWISEECRSTGKRNGSLDMTDIVSVSDLRGQGMHEVYRDAWRDDPLYLDRGVSRAEWLPDEKHISFVQNNTLWTMPVDAP